MLKRMIGYVKDAEILGEVTGIDFVNQMVMLKDDEESHTVKVSDVEFLKEAFEMNELIIFDKDVLGDVYGNMYLVERHEDGEITLHHIDEKFEVKSSGDKFPMTNSILEDFAEVFDLVGNIYELKNSQPKEPTFNINIVKDFNGKHFTYFYACNNKKDKEIDLIKVLFLGSTLIEEEEHERRTISYEKYMEAINNGVYKEASPQELQNYVAGLLYGKQNETHYPVTEEEIEEEIECGVNCECTTECEEDGSRIFHFDFSQVTVEKDESEDTSKSEDAPVAPKKCEECNETEDLCDCDLW